MKAIELSGPFQLHMVERPMPVRKKGQALLRMRSMSLCGSDINAYRGANSLVKYPVILGHELTGEIVEIDNDNPRRLRPGDLVQVDPYLYCGQCYACSIGRTNCCKSLSVVGVHQDGGMAEYFVHPASMLYRAPQQVPLAFLPLSEPLAIALHELNRLNLKAGENLCIFGAGPIGLLAAMAAASRGVDAVLVDVLPSRLAYANKLGFSKTVYSMQEDALKQLELFSENQGFACCLEASGAVEAIKMSMEVASHAGRIALTGWPKKPLCFDSGIITRKELDVRGARTAAGEIEQALSLMEQGKVDVSGVLSCTVPFRKLPEAVEMMAANPEKYLKISCVMDII